MRVTFETKPVVVSVNLEGLTREDLRYLWNLMGKQSERFDLFKTLDSAVKDMEKNDGGAR